MSTSALEKQTDIMPSAITPLSLIQSALSKNVAPEVLKELVALQQSMIRFGWEAEERQAKIDFDDAKVFTIIFVPLRDDSALHGCAFEWDY